jgi:U2 small nuclear ribonucleoprotein A'
VLHLPCSPSPALTGNSITLLSSLVPLESCTNLRYLSLGGNPVCNEEHYRSFALWKVAGGQLHVLDFQRVKDAERVAAKDLFLTAGPDRQPNALAATLCASTASTSVGAVDGEKAAGGAKGGRQMTAEDKEKVKKAILAADSTDEMRRLEKMLASGVVPGDHDL